MESLPTSKVVMHELHCTACGNAEQTHQYLCLNSFPWCCISKINFVIKLVVRLYPLFKLRWNSVTHCSDQNRIRACSQLVCCVFCLHPACRNSSHFICAVKLIETSLHTSQRKQHTIHSVALQG